MPPNFTAPAPMLSCEREIKDPDNVAVYVKMAAQALYGVCHLCRGTTNSTFEAGFEQRGVESEFPSLDQAIAAHNGAGYQEALGEGAVRDIRIIEGLE